MSHATLKTAATGLAFALIVGFGSAQAMPFSPLGGTGGLSIEVGQYYNDDDDRAYGYRGRALDDYDDDARDRGYGGHSDEIDALQYMFPQTYGWPRGTRDQF